MPRLEEEIEDLRAQLERAGEEAGRLAELNAKVAQAKSLDDLLS